MKATYQISWRVWYIPAMKQWVVMPPDGFYSKSGEFIILTNLHPLYYPRQMQAWGIAIKNAKTYNSCASLYYMYKQGVRETRDYRTYNEKVQAT